MFSPQEYIYIYRYDIYIYTCISFQLFLRITLFLKTGKASVFPSLLKSSENVAIIDFSAPKTPLYFDVDLPAPAPCSLGH